MRPEIFGNVDAKAAYTPRQNLTEVIERFE
jgi:hypothetical protein